jgi:asparagine synthase (glutamine-hydrolysing)
LDPVAIDLYFHYQYVPEPATPVKNVRKLDAAHILTVDVGPWQVEETCYWRMEEASLLEDNPAELIRSELETISELVIRSDVPVGVALSGGLDSSAIAALAAQKYPGTMHAFSVGYPGRPGGDEREEAKTLADHFGMPFHDVELSTDDMVAFFPELVYWRDDPIADISGYGYYAVMKLAREHGVPVMLQGQGGDELFWGYDWVRQAVLESMLKENLLKGGWRSSIDYLRPELPRSCSLRDLWEWISSLAGLRNGLQRLWRHKADPPERMVFYDLSRDFRLASTGLENMCTDHFLEHLNGTKAFDLFSFQPPWPQGNILFTRLICQTYLLGNGIVQGDRLGMASSVEQRLPLVDYRLVETVIGLRKSRADHREPPKAWLKAALKDVVPEWVLNRRKRGFTPPVPEWHRALFSAYGSLLDDGYLVQTNVVKPESSRDLALGPFTRNLVAPLSFKALVLEMWCRQFSAE